MRDEIYEWLQPFGLDGLLNNHAAHVLQSLPIEVRTDIMGDAGVVFYDYQPGPGVVMQVPVRIPTRNGASRSVVLKRTLTRREPEFVRWLIAHEIAHAHLRNAGRWPGEDPEHAADALAEGWGYPRPSMW